MGYYVRTQEQNFLLPQRKLKDAHAAMVALDTTHHSEKRGGSWSNGEQQERWFSWMPIDYAVTCETAEAILTELGFEIQHDVDGSIIGLEYDNKIGQESLFLQAIAPFVEKGSYINWIGEDGALWQYFFDGQKMVELEAKITYTTTTEEE